MQPGGNQLLARPALAQHDTGTINLRQTLDMIKQAEKGRVFANKSRKAVHITIIAIIGEFRYRKSSLYFLFSSKALILQ